ncbi:MULTISPECIES: NAD-dependent epimerase/dehydratase family protein [unclassified Sutcliffiella]|uniref:NAD-dependent epimerase/dehydratase family protein n=1 Tax=unclassified Sutcliffiella TaxID=2837532 RepID=UPI0030D3AE61
MRTVAIIGGAGFIGSHLFNYFYRRGIYPKIIDISESNNFENFSSVDILDREKLMYELKGVNEVFHLASLVGVDSCLIQEERLFRTSIEGTINVLDSCIKNGVEKITFASSSEVYGELTESKMKESGNFKPKSPYGKTKLECEKILYYYKDNIQTNIVRFFNVYGEGQRTDFVINKFISSILNDDFITIYGDGEQTRCFTYINDAITGMLAAHNYKSIKNYEIFNIGNKNSISINSLVELLGKIIGKSPKIHYLEYGNNGVRPREIEVFNRFPDTNKAESLLNFTAKTELQKGLRNIVRFYYSNMVNK